MSFFFISVEIVRNSLVSSHVLRWRCLSYVVRRLCARGHKAERWVRSRPPVVVRAVAVTHGRGEQGAQAPLAALPPGVWLLGRAGLDP